MVTERFIFTVAAFLLSYSVAVPTRACVSSDALDQAEDDDRVKLVQLDSRCRRAFRSLQGRDYVAALGDLESLLPYETVFMWPVRLGYAEALMGAGIPPKRSLQAWERLQEPTALVNARIKEIVGRLEPGRAARLLEADPKRPAADWLSNKHRMELQDAQKLAAPVPEETSRLRVGVLLPLSGRLQNIGKALLLGIRARLQEPTQLVIRDTGSLGPARIESLMDDLATAGVAVVIGPVDKNNTSTAVIRATHHDLALISLSPQAPTAGDGFHAFVSRENHCDALVQRAKAKGARRFAVIGANSAYGSALAAAFQGAVQRQNLKIVSSVEYDSDSLNLAGPAQRLARRTFDALFIADTPSRAPSVLRYVARAGVMTRGTGRVGSRDGVNYVQLLAPSEWLGKPFAEDDSQYLSGTWIATEWSGVSAPEVAPLRQDLKQRFGLEPTVFHAIGYDALGIVEELKENHPKRLLHGLRRSRFQGVLGRTGFRSDGAVQRDIRLYRVQGQGYKRVGTMRLSSGRGS